MSAFGRSLLLLAAPLICAAGAYEYPGDPPWDEHVITAEDLAAAKAAKTGVIEHLYGDRAEVVRRFNRLGSRFARKGRVLRVPVVDEYVPVPAAYPYGPSEGKRILVVLVLQFVGAYEDGVLVASYPAVTGDREHVTPPGDYRISRKDRDHESSKYPEPDGGWPMPWAIRFNGNGYWIHAGDMVGRPSSHGCVRLFMKDAEALFHWAEIGTKVKVVVRLPEPPPEPASREPLP